MKEGLATEEVNCGRRPLLGPPGRTYCASARQPGVLIYEDGFKEEGVCGSLKKSLLHELVHKCNGIFDESLPEECEESCFGSKLK